MTRLLFSPIRLGRLTLKNRLVMPAMHLNFTPDGFVNSQLIEFYRVRARGGAALFQIGGCPVEAGAGAEFMIGLNDEKYLPGLKNLTDAIHGEGGLCGCQLYHAGRYTYSFFLGGKAAPSASATLSGLTREMSREMTHEEILATIDDFASCAERAVRAGFDAVEVIASAGYLINQFYSPLTNLRTDQWGGSEENRARFGVEVVKAVVRAVGPDVPVTVRLSGHDFVPNSNTHRENARLARCLEEAGASMFNVTGGWHETNVPQITYHLPHGGYSHLAREVKNQVSVPVAAANRINDPAHAERLLEEGICDLISLGRSLIADPEWPNKAQSERSDEILPCISCNQLCLDNVFQMKPIGCLMNPEVGREHLPPSPATPKKRVLVVGGGPAGLVAATTAARRGHSVTLLEKEAAPGGQIPAASAAPDKSSFLEVARAWTRQTEKAGVAVETGVSVDEAELKRRAFDLLVVATGAESAIPPIQGVTLPHVRSAVKVLANAEPIGQSVVVIGGGPVGVEAALYCAHVGAIDPETAAFLLKHRAQDPDTIRARLWRGHKTVTLVEMMPKVGQAIGKSTRWVAMKELSEMGVTILVQAKVLRITPESVWVETPQGEKTLPADTVLLAAGMKPHRPFPLPPDALVIGDAAGVSDAAAAIAGAYAALNEV